MGRAHHRQCTHKFTTRIRTISARKIIVEVLHCIAGLQHTQHSVGWVIGHGVPSFFCSAHCGFCSRVLELAHSLWFLFPCFCYNYRILFLGWHGKETIPGVWREFLRFSSARGCFPRGHGALISVLLFLLLFLSLA